MTETSPPGSEPPPAVAPVVKANVADGRWNRLRRKGWFYWVSVLAIALLGIYLSHLLEARGPWIEARYIIHQGLQSLDPRKPYVKDTVLVLIGNDEYWKGELARRVPFKRDYLARLLIRLDMAEPAVIAVDFNLRSPVGDGSLREHPAYQEETQTLLETVKSVSSRRPVILPLTIAFDARGRYLSESDIHSGFDWGDSAKNVRFGYIALSFDSRRVPVSLNLVNRGPTDSFALAIVRAFRPQALEGQRTDGSLPFGSYLPSEKFPQHSAGTVLTTNTADLKEKVSGRVVIIGGIWNQFAYERGRQIDSYLTPVGTIPGALIHANNVEALLDHRTTPPMPRRLPDVIEFGFVILGAVIFTLQRRWYIRVLTAIGLCLGLIVLSYVFLRNLGVYFDAIVPLAMIAGHSILDEAREWEIRGKLDR